MTTTAYQFFAWERTETRLTPGHLLLFWELMDWKRVFYDGSVQSFKQFLSFARSGENLIWAIYQGPKPLGLVWLNGFTGKAAFVHLTSFRGAERKHTTAAARQFMAMVFSARDPLDKSRHFLETLVGITPSSYSLALRFARACGFVEQARIPQAIHLAHEGRYEDAVLTCRTRDMEV